MKRTQASPTRRAAASRGGRSLHFYHYGDLAAPFCEASAHVTAHIAATKHQLDPVKVITIFHDGYRAKCGREPTYAWHTVAAVKARGELIMMDPVFRCGTQTREDYLRSYVAADCPAFEDFDGCPTVTMEEWKNHSYDSAGVCISVITPGPVYNLLNCQLDEQPAGWTDEDQIARAYSWVRPPEVATHDYESRPGANGSEDFACFAQPEEGS